MNQGRNKLWWAFWGGVLLIVAALSWASITVYTLQARSEISRAMNQRQELIRLALWRMDSRLAPMIALEAARPIEDYETMLGEQEESFGLSYEKAAGRSEKKVLDGGLYNRGFFEIDELGSTKGSGSEADAIAILTNMQQKMLDKDLVSQESENNKRMDSREMVDGAVSSGAMMMPERSINPPAKAEADFEARQKIANIAQNRQAISTSPAMEEPLVAALDSTEYASGDAMYSFDFQSSDKKKANAQEGLERMVSDSKDTGVSGYFDDDGLSKVQDVSEIQVVSGIVEAADAVDIIDVIGAIEPRWVLRDDGVHELVLTRTIQRGGHTVVQGVWLDWESMSRELLESIRDLLPPSALIPITSDRVQPIQGKRGPQLPSYRLATVPVSFIPGGMIQTGGGGLTPAMMAMLVTWIAVILAMVAVGLVLRTVLTLSARRAHFVGAVTHELRTPLTTFRLYSQMLADGMVTDEAVRKEYLNTLKRESDRLTGIVENVLEYARISRQRYGKDKPKGEQQLSVGELIARIVPPMSRLGEQSGMDLVVSDETGQRAQRTVTLDPHAIERIVMNLMDNACKYAGVDAESDQESDLRVHLDASIVGDSLLLVVADHGPGVASRDRRKIFGEFVRGSSPALRDRSGLGLGLALSRGLAVEMGGDLSLIRRRGHGAEFELRIPLDDEVLS
ncbi:MAG: HAMP domain-containing histidine kinase [Phycisphaerales bacterium]|nr:HAMP domain-containing histidine kinase [Phycisphaerales bacterium]